MNLAIEDLKEQYQNFEDDFSSFFEDLRIFSEEKLLSLRGRMTK